MFSWQNCIVGFDIFLLLGSSGGSDHLKEAAAGSSASDSDLTSLAGPHVAIQPQATGNGNGSSNGSERSSGTTQAPQQAKDIAGSRQSFKIAMGNPCEMFVDVM